MEVQFAHDQLLKAALCPGNLRVQGSLFGVIIIDGRCRLGPAWTLHIALLSRK